MADSPSNPTLPVFPDDLLWFSQELIQESFTVCVRQSAVSALQPLHLGLQPDENPYPLEQLYLRCVLVIGFTGALGCWGCICCIYIYCSHL